MILRLIMAAGLSVAVPNAVRAASETVDGQPATVGNAPCDWFKKERNDTWKTSH